MYRRFRGSPAVGQGLCLTRPRTSPGALSPAPRRMAPPGSPWGALVCVSATLANVGSTLYSGLGPGQFGRGCDSAGRFTTQSLARAPGALADATALSRPMSQPRGILDSCDRPKCLRCRVAYVFGPWTLAIAVPFIAMSRGATGGAEGLMISPRSSRSTSASG
jgi:hypothetical protein